MAGENIPQSDKALLEAQAMAGPAGVKAFQAATAQLESQGQQASAEALAGAAGRSGRTAGMDQALQAGDQTRARRQEALTAEGEARQMARTNRNDRYAAYQDAVQGTRGLIKDQAMLAAAPIRAQGEFNLANIRAQGQNDVSRLAGQIDVDRARFEAEARARAQAAALEEERFNRQLAASRSSGGGGGGGGGGGASIAQGDIDAMVQAAGVDQLEQAFNMAQGALGDVMPEVKQAITAEREARFYERTQSDPTYPSTTTQGSDDDGGRYRPRSPADIIASYNAPPPRGSSFLDNPADIVGAANPTKYGGIGADMGPGSIGGAPAPWVEQDAQGNARGQVGHPMGWTGGGSQQSPTSILDFMNSQRTDTRANANQRVGETGMDFNQLQNGSLFELALQRAGLADSGFNSIYQAANQSGINIRDEEDLGYALGMTPFQAPQYSDFQAKYGDREDSQNPGQLLAERKFQEAMGQAGQHIVQDEQGGPMAAIQAAMGLGLQGVADSGYKMTVADLQNALGKVQGQSYSELTGQAPVGPSAYEADIERQMMMNMDQQEAHKTDLMDYGEQRETDDLLMREGQDEAARAQILSEHGVDIADMDMASPGEFGNWVANAPIEDALTYYSSEDMLNELADQGSPAEVATHIRKTLLNDSARPDAVKEYVSQNPGQIQHLVDYIMGRLY